MKISIDTAGQFRDQFAQCGRKDQFSYEALGLLFDYFEEIDPDMELDVVAICCEYCEDTYEGIAKNYVIDLEGCESEQDEIEAIRDYLNDNTSIVGETAAGFVYLSF
jgi:hypothetical protein